MKRLVVIDGKSVFYRGYYAMPGLSLKDGTPTGGVYGFAALSLEVIRKLKPDYVAVAWDKPKTNIRRRKELYPDYKAGRKPAPPDFYAQIPMLHELLEAFGWPLYECDDYEADDIMGALAIKANERDVEACLVTSDLDMLQLINGKTHVYVMKKGFTNIELYNPVSFQEKYGIRVDQFLDLKSLKGDSSDNIPGVAGIGEKTALGLLQEYETLDGVYENIEGIKETLSKKLIAGKDSAYLSKELARIWIDAPIEFSFEAMNAADLDTAKLAKLLADLEFKSLLKNLPENMQHIARQTEASKENLSLLPAKAWDRTCEEKLLQTSEPIFAHMHEESSSLWLSDGGAAYKLIVTDHKEVIQKLLKRSSLNLCAYDIKFLGHQLNKQGIDISCIVHHDMRQAAFLLNPLERDRSLEYLLPGGTNFDEPSEVMAGLTHVYRTQKSEFNSFPELSKVASDIDFPLTLVLLEMEKNGITLDTPFLKNMSDELALRIDEVQSTMFAMVDEEFNIGSPAQLARILFTKLLLPTGGIKKGKTGYSTGQKELDKLRGQHPIIELIEEFRELTKLKNTYIDTLPKLVDEKSRVHTTFNQDVAATGRLSSTDPNLQNIPIRSEIGRKIRTGFVASEGNVFVSADYSQFELRLAAILAHDEQLIKDFNGELDIHTKTASDVFKIPLGEVTKDQRRAAKVINFGVLYGMSPHGLSVAAKMTFEEARHFIDEYFKLRAPIRRYIDETIEKATTAGFVQTYFGRRRPTPDITSSNFMIREGAKRAAANMPIQGTEADLMKMAMIKVKERLSAVASTKQSFEETRKLKNSKFPEPERLVSSKDVSRHNAPLGQQLLQIHDSILIECPEKNAEKVSTMLVNTMETIYPELGIKLKVDVSIGKNWGEL